MATTTTTTTSIPPSDLVELLAGDRVLAAARQLLAARVRRERVVREPNEDTAHNGQPHANARFHAESDARDALRQLSDEVDRAARRLAREATKR